MQTAVIMGLGYANQGPSCPVKHASYALAITPPPAAPTTGDRRDSDQRE